MGAVNKKLFENLDAAFDQAPHDENISVKIGTPPTDLSSAEETLLTPVELAERLKMSTSWVYKEVHYGRLPHLKVGTSVRFLFREVIESLRRRTKKKDSRK